MQGLYACAPSSAIKNDLRLHGGDCSCSCAWRSFSIRYHEAYDRIANKIRRSTSAKQTRPPLQGGSETR